MQAVVGVYCGGGIDQETKHNGNGGAVLHLLPGGHFVLTNS